MTLPAARPALGFAAQRLDVCVPSLAGSFVLRKEGKPSWKMPDVDGFMLKPYVHVQTPAAPPAPPVIAT